MLNPPPPGSHPPQEVYYNWDYPAAADGLVYAQLSTVAEGVDAAVGQWVWAGSVNERRVQYCLIEKRVTHDGVEYLALRPTGRLHTW